MPTYDYECDACSHTFELFQGINDPVQTKCPECGKKKLRRLFGTGGAIMFKGSGFYQTDYRSESYKQAASAEKSASEPKSGDSKSSDSKSSGAKSAESSSKSKPEAKAKPKGS
ncbi:MAG: FmdB family zinc ribbon protein [Planctomycetaceae bacterium]